MVGATVRQNKSYTVPLTTMTAATVQRFNRRHIGFATAAFSIVFIERKVVQLRSRSLPS